MSRNDGEDDSEWESNSVSSDDELPDNFVLLEGPDFEPDLQKWEATVVRGAEAAAPVRDVFLSDRCGGDDYVETERRRRADPERHRIIRRSFGRFVTLLDRYGREGVKSVNFQSMYFGDPGYGFDEEDQARLFGEVIPSLPFLKKVFLFRGSLPIAHLKTFVSRLSVTTSSLVKLDLCDCGGDFAMCVPEIAAMIRRNVPLRVLELNAKQMMDRDSCRQIFESLQDNTHLRSLKVKVEEVYDDVPIVPTNKASSLRRLRIDVERWTLQGKSSLARQLRINTRLGELHVFGGTGTGQSITHRPWIETLKSHNYTLYYVDEATHSPDMRNVVDMNDMRVVALLGRNTRIRRGLRHMPGYHVAPVALLPSVLELVSDFPTLVYRFVRLGDITALCDLLVARQRQRSSDTNSNNKKKRILPTPSASLRRSARVARLHK